MSSSHTQNSLDLLRLLAAWMVLFSHQFALLGLPEPSFMGLNTFGGAGVAVFFFLSGSLVWSSWRRDAHWGRYLARRALRIFPALWLVVLLSAVVLGPVLTTLALPDYFEAQETRRYLLNGLLSIKYNLPGVFEDNALKAVNGSLWTLPAEFLSYLLVGVWGWARWRGWPLRVALGVLLMVALSSWLWSRHGVTKPELEVMALFWWGAAYGEYRWASQNGERWPWPVWFILLLALVVFAGMTYQGYQRSALMLLAAGAVHLSMQVSWGGVLLRRLGDVSYGVYIYAFPVQQTLIHLYPHESFMTHLCLSTLITLVLAYASWHFIEKVALRWKPKGAFTS